MKTVVAADSATALKTAPNIARNSGVSLVPDSPTSKNLPASSISTPTTTTTAADRNKAFSTTPSYSTTTTPTSGPLTTTQLYQATSLPEATTFVQTQPKVDLNAKISQVAGTTLSATGKAIDDLLAQQEVQNKAQLDNATKNRDQVVGQIKDRLNSTDAQDALSAIYKKFNVDDTISQLRDINTKIVQAQEALQMGLIYEGDRPVRMTLLSGRQASLQKQGLATIGALQGTAQVLQGNIDLARSYAATTIDAINSDNQNSLTALNTLLNLYNNDLIDFTKQERDIVTTRITSLQDENKILEQNKQDVMDLMVKYPTAFLKGGVTLLDDKATAIEKMIPTMSSMEMQKFNAEQAVLAKQAASTTNKDGSAADKTQLLALKAKGMTYEEALGAFSDTVSTSWIQSVYRESSTPATGKDAFQNAYYNQFLTPDGKIDNSSFTIDKNGNPVAKGSSSGGGFLSSVGHAIGSFFKSL